MKVDLSVKNVVLLGEKMNKKKWLSLIVCLLVSSCVATKKTESPVLNEKQNAASEERLTDLATLSADLSILLKKFGAEVLVQDFALSPEGDLILKVTGNACFAEGATITIKKESFGDLEKVVIRMCSIMKINKEQSGPPILELVFSDTSNVPVKFSK